MRRPDPARPYIRAFYAHNRLRFLVTAALYMLQIPAMLIVSWVLGEVIDAVAALDAARLVRLLWAAAGVAVFLGVSEALYYRALSGWLGRALRQYKSCAFQKLSEKGISAFARENTGRYLAVLTSDVTVIGSDYLQSLFDLIMLPLNFAATLVFLLTYSPALTGASVALCVLPFLGVTVFGPGLARREKALSDANEGFVGRVKDLLAGFAVIKSFKAEPEAGRIFNGEDRALEHARSRRLRWRGAMQGAGSSLSVIMQFGMFFIGAYLALRGSITAGTVLIFTNLSHSLIQPVQQIPQLLAQRKAARGLIEKLATVTEENAARRGEPIEPALRDAIELQDVSFAYEPGKPVLQNVSMRLEAGKKYALVGPSGSGKSTLLHLLMGAHDGYTGSLTVDGRQMRAIDPDSLYDLESLIGQSVFLFDDTIRRNITMFRNFPDGAVDSAASRAGLCPLLAERGEDYRCGENGAGLSGGERQRISIARALLRGTPVLLLDEATAALDNETAYAVASAILDLEGLTRLVVTHRLEASLLARYDEVFVLRDGAVAERGTFADLMARKGYFYSLYTVANG